MGDFDREFRKAFYEKIIELRNQIGKSQASAAEEMGISNTALNNYEKGLRKPKYDALKKIADYYGVTIDYLLGVDETTETEWAPQTQILLQTLRGASEKEIAQAVKIVEALKGTMPDDQ